MKAKKPAGIKKQTIVVKDLKARKDPKGGAILDKLGPGGSRSK